MMQVSSLRLGTCLMLGLIFNHRSGMAGKSGRCPSGRLFFGSLNEANAEYIPYTGIYQSLDGATYSNRLVYKHTATEAYIYFLSASGFWAVGPEVGSEKPTMIAPVRSSSPETTQPIWHLWNAETRTWTSARGLKIVCVDRDFAPCTSGRVHVTGISNRNWIQQRRMGVYVITNQTHGLRPVYKHSEQEEFLWYTQKAGGIWLVGPEVGNTSGGMFAPDVALRPEFIFQDWTVFSGKHLVLDKGIKIRCHGINLSENPPETEDLEEVEEVEEVEELLRPVPSEGWESRDAAGSESDQDTYHLSSRRMKEGGASHPVCDDSRCQHGGRCKRDDDAADDDDDGDDDDDDDNFYFCICSGPYFGINCQIDIDCGQPISDSDLQIVATTGHYFLDVIFYRCPANTVLDGPAGVICQIDGTWTAPPKCLDGYHLITPQHDDETVLS